MAFMTNAQIQIAFEIREDKKHATDLNDAITTAIYLAINPNFNTVEEGISLTGVEVVVNGQTINFKKK